VYDPAPLLEVAALEVGPRGVVGQTEDGPVLDVHHADHPDTRNVRLANGLSLLPRAHYTALRARYGPHLVDGAAGESLLLDTDGRWTEADLDGGLWLEAADGDLLALEDAMAAPPCVEFSRFCLSLPVGPVGPDVSQALLDLDGGARGFYVRVVGTGRVERGAPLLRG
jgi:MOSC domain-containing protein YiiM